MKTTLFGFTLLLLASCAGEVSTGNDSLKKDTAKKDTLRDTSVREMPATDGDMELFSNVEQVDFSVPVPLQEYKLNSKRSDTKAKFIFEHTRKKDNEIRVQGMFRDDESVSLADYSASSFSDAEEEGKIILQKGVVAKNNCFYTKGYWSNMIYESRFIEVVWLRKSDVVVFEAHFDVADTTIWNKRLEQLLESNSEFQQSPE